MLHSMASGRHSLEQALADDYEQGRLDAALARARLLLRQHSDNGRAWEWLGLIHAGRERFRLAVSALERASLLVPLRSAARVCLGLGYGKVGRATLSRDLLTALIDDPALDVPLLLQVAAGLDALGESPLACAACRAAIARDPLVGQPYYDLGYYSARSGSPPHIVESLARRAISLDPQNTCYRVGLASLLLRQNRGPEAYDLVRHFTPEQITLVECRCCLGRIIDLYEQARDYRRIVMCREQLLKLEIRSVEDDCL